MINSKITFNDFQARFFFTSVGLNVWFRIHGGKKKSLRGRNLKLYIHFCFSALAEGEKKNITTSHLLSLSALRAVQCQWALLKVFEKRAISASYHKKVGFEIFRRFFCFCCEHLLRAH